MGHTAGNVAPVSKTVIYETAETNLNDSIKCWITQNLGADHQAVSATDASEASAGWYWQFNRKQGYKHDGTTRTPNMAWITPISENSDWLVANDPCSLLLGADWRLPTYSEWSSIDANSGWDNYNETYSSIIKLHLAGYLDSGNGLLSYRGSSGYYWSNSQYGNNFSWGLFFNSSNCDIHSGFKAIGQSARCLRD
jgi:hypothetical protein